AFQLPALFPRAGKTTHDKLRAWFDRLLSADQEVRDAALTDKELNANVELLIEATQAEIIHNDLPAVITDALEEQADWGEVHVVPKTDGDGTQRAGARSTVSPPGDAIFRPLDRRPDPFA